MAKISARGDVERWRWRHPETGAELVYTSRGRLLSKPKGGSFTLLEQRIGENSAIERAASRGMERV
jgi:hypothetical protein